MKKIINLTNLRKGLKRNYRQVIFVFAAFALMALSAFILIGRIISNRLSDRTKEMIQTAEANVKAGLLETESILLNSYYIVQGMIEQDASGQEILDYLTITTEWLRRREGLFGYYGIYGFINEEFYDSIGLNPGPDYIPQTRPWYHTAVRSNSNVIAYTVPYEDAQSGDIIITAVRNIEFEGSVIGILAIDVNINWLKEYISGFALTEGGYGLLLSQNMTIMAHPNGRLIGLQLQDLGGDYVDIVRTLLSGEDIFGSPIIDWNGKRNIVFFTRIINDWYIGSEAPFFMYFSDLYVSAMILVVLGLILSLLLGSILLNLSAEKIRADENSKTKSSFLANMSHEIRTPMNAINGMAELLLRGNLTDESRAYAQDIKNAGNSLISIINDLLDFSKIEAGKLEINTAKYMVASLVNNTVNIIRMRLEEKPLRFFTNIDSNIPSSLVGDEARMRQILLNLLSNAVKYSEKGNISLSIFVEKQEEKKVWLKITVADTGKGIKPEDQTKLFGDFVQFDKVKNRGIEGTGLGLAITKRLCVAMGGDISVESEYGKGSAFTVIIPQIIDSDEPFAAVEDAANRHILVYEGRDVYANSVCWSLKSMNVPYTLVKTQDEFRDALNNEKYFFVISGYGLYDRVKQVMDQFSGEKPPLALMVEWRNDTNIPNVHFVSVPTMSLSLANVLNGKVRNNVFSEIPKIASFTCPSARILLVDDIATNLKVAEGLLAPYHAAVDSSLSGISAIELVKHEEFDIVFMDHMMPEMDGITATGIIRELEGERFKDLPIVALTANALAGRKEMFVDNGFTDFLAKPIDVTKLDEILTKWIPNEKKKYKTVNIEHQPESFTDIIIPGVDVRHGISMTGGIEELYKQVLSIFWKDVKDRLPMLQKIPQEDDLELFTIQVHSLKSASSAIGAKSISAEAAALEAAGKKGDLDYIGKKLPEFEKKLGELIENIRDAMKFDKEEAAPAVSGEDSTSAVSASLLRRLKAALQSKKMEEINSVLDELTGQQMDSKTKEIVNKISDEILMAEYDNAIITMETLTAASE